MIEFHKYIRCPNENTFKDLRFYLRTFTYFYTYNTKISFNLKLIKTVKILPFELNYNKIHLKLSLG